MKFKKFVQQHIELIVICFSAILGVLEVVVARYPASMMILMVVFLIVPVMYVFKSSGRNYGKMNCSSLCGQHKKPPCRRYEV